LLSPQIKFNANLQLPHQLLVIILRQSKKIYQFLATGKRI